MDAQQELEFLKFLSNLLHIKFNSVFTSLSQTLPHGIHPCAIEDVVSPIKKYNCKVVSSKGTMNLRVNNHA